MYKIDNFSVSDFLKLYWQKHPTVIKQGFTDFVDPMDEHELAGLAQENEIDARIISRENEQWQVHSGPFEDFEQVCQGQWTLLVQSVDHYLEAPQGLLEAFNFIPSWRIDDLMVSYSVTGAGVGPHIDQYDVFIVQGKGKRRWQVGQKGTYKEFSPAPLLRQVEEFRPIIDEVLEPGDVIYIPPGFPHNGEALTDCLNYSVGFRAPDQKQLLSSFADYVLDNPDFNDRYTDPELQHRQHTAKFNPNEIEKLRTLLLSTLKSDNFADWAMTFASSSKLDVSQHNIPESPYSPHEIETLLKNGHYFVRTGGTKCLYNEDLFTSQKSEFYVDGQRFTLPASDADQLVEFLNRNRWTTSLCKNSTVSLDFVTMLTTLVNSGLWFPEI